MGEGHSFNDARAFLSRVWDWPEPTGDGYVNLHWMLPRNDGNGTHWQGKALKNIDGVIQQLNWVSANRKADIYFCISVQEKTEQRQGLRGPFEVALRAQHNARNSKVFAIDIDFKGGDHGYADLNEAAAELGRFLKETGLPRPTTIVHSGGGMHVYWIVDRALTQDEWLPIALALAEATKAHGLKCDTQCTVDIVRILRVPNTINRKGGGARPVTMLTKIQPDDTPVDALSGPLASFVGVPGTSLALTPKRPLAGVSDLAAGIEPTKASPVSIKLLREACPFVAEAATTGGAGYSNPLWNLTTLIATFTEEGRLSAHLMARKHADYTVPSTDELYARKEQDRQRRDLGWPKCATISATGAGPCATCPLLQQGKSPLAFARPNTAPSGVPTATSTNADPDMPTGYVRRSDGVILRLASMEDGSKAHIPVSEYPMIEPWLQREPWILNFTTIAEKGKRHQIALETSIIDTGDMRKSLQGQGMMIKGNEFKHVGVFLMAWVTHLQAQKNAIVSSAPFGWNYKGGKVDGFIYGGFHHSSAGERPAANPDPVISQQYRPTGEKQPWIDAAAMITSQGRPQLDALIAASFGAPLVEPTGQLGMLMAANSVESGIGKSTTLKIGQAVWGDPIRGMQSLSDTANSVIHKIGELRSLPLFWDELKTEQDTRKFVNITFNMGQGKEKSRLTSRASQRQSGTWQTLLVSASNESLLDMIEAQTRHTTAGIYRIFEYEVPPGVKGQINPMDAQRTVAKLNNNYGVVGNEYAKWLGTNYPRIHKEIGEYNADLLSRVGQSSEERFWIATIVTVVMGARYANELGFTTFDVDALEAFMIDTLNKMRGIRSSAVVDMKDTNNVSNVISQFFQQMRAKNTLFTNIARTGVGRPTPGSIKVLRDATRLEGIYVRVGMDDKVVRISSTRLTEWLHDKGYSRSTIVRELTDQFGAKSIKGRIGSGTELAGATEYLLEIDLNNAAQLNFIDEA